MPNAEVLAATAVDLRGRNYRPHRILGDADISTLLTGVRMPCMNAIMERWAEMPRAELLDRTLIWNETHPRHALRRYERHYNQHRTHRALAASGATPTRPS